MVKSKEDYVDFGIHVLRTMREEAELTLAEMAERMGVQNQTIANWESGKSCLDVVQFRAWCRACHKDGIPYLLGWDNPQTNDDTPYSQPLKHAIAYMPEEYQRMWYNAITQDFWPVLLQLLTVYLDIPLRGRIIASENLLNIYRAARYELHLRPERVGRETIEPDLGMIYSHLRAALEATKMGTENYYVEEFTP